MESIKELRQMLQTNVLGHPILQRVLSIYLTRPLLSTSVTPNQVTVFMLLLGIAGAAMIFMGWFWQGLIVMYLNILFDAVDGEIARYKKMYSQRGVYLDLVNHLLTEALFFTAATFYIAGLPGAPVLWVLIPGMLGALAMSIRRANGDLHRVMVARQYSEKPELFARLPAEAVTQQNTPRPTPSLARRARGLLYDSHELAPMLIIFFLAYIAEVSLFPGAGHPVLSWIVVFYGVTACLYLLREIVGGYRAVEGQMTALARKLKSPGSHE